MADEATVLMAEDIVAGYLPEVDVLRGVSLIVREGEVVTIVGPNGAGKSTLVKGLMGLVPPRSGKVWLGGEDLTGLSAHTIARKGVGYVPQRSNVFPSLTVEENLELGAIPRPDLRVRERMEELAELFPILRHRRSQRAGTLSGGERQMVAMARALMPEPNVLILDEPSAGLAPAYVDLVFERVTDINRAGVTVLMVEQNARAALAMSDRGYVLDLGKNRFDGPAESLLDDPKIAELYLGGARLNDD